MRNKRGSHVGMVLSFTMFIIFLIFVYVIIESPINSKKQNENLFEIIKSEVVKESSGLVYTVRAYDLVNSGGCVEVLIPDNDFTNISGVVRNETSEIDSEISGFSSLVPGGFGFMKFYYSDNFFEVKEVFSGGGCVAINKDSVSEEIRVLEKKIILLLERMRENYTLIKNEFGLPNNVDFNLQFDYGNGTVLSSSEFEEAKVETFATKISLNYLDVQANEKTGELMIRIW